MDPNINCLFYCASAITGFEINSIVQFNDFLLYYKIIDVSSDNNNFDDIVKIISDFFNDKLPNIFEDKDNNDTLLKMLLLTIVIYILKSNESNKKSILMELCEKIPRTLHANACAMFAPIIMRFNDGEKVTDDDLDECLNGCDKENQMMFFSPIKNNDKLPDQRTFATQKQKNHQSIKAGRNYEQFTIFVDDFFQNEDEEPSAFAKLLKYVQSPAYQSSKLMKCNRDLRKNVNESDNQLSMSSTLDTKIDNSLRHDNRLLNANEVLKEMEVQNVKSSSNKNVLSELVRIHEETKTLRQESLQGVDGESLITDIDLLECKNDIQKKKSDLIFLELKSKKDEKFSALRLDLKNAVETIDGIKLTLSKANWENEEIKSDISRKLVELEQLILHLESSIVAKDKMMEDLQLLLTTKDEDTVLQQKEFEEKTSSLEKDNLNDRNRINVMSEIIKELEETGRSKSVELSETYFEISSYKQSIKDHEKRNAELQTQLDNLVIEVQLKDNLITEANDTIHQLTQMSDEVNEGMDRLIRDIKKDIDNQKTVIE